MTIDHNFDWVCMARLGLVSTGFVLGVANGAFSIAATGSMMDAAGDGTTAGRDARGQHSPNVSDLHAA